MKNTVLLRIISVFMIVLCLLLTGCNRTSTDTTDTDETPVEENKNTAPNFTVYDMEENEITLESKFGGPIVINFWATWCPPCVGELPYFQNMYEKYGDKVTFMMVNLTDGAEETKEGVSAFIYENGYTFPVYLDTKTIAAAEYAISAIPYTVFIDSNGNIVETKKGALEENALEKSIKALLKG